MGLGITLIVILLIKIDIQLLINSLNNIHVLPLIVTFLLSLLGIPSAALNIQILMKSLKHVSFKHLARYQTYNYIGSIFLPLSTSDLSVVYSLKKEYDVSPGRGISIILTDKAITFFLTVIIAFFGLLYYINFRYASQIAILLLVAGIISIYFLFYNKQLRKFVIKYVLRKYAVKLKGLTFQFRDLITHHKKLIVYNTLITLFRTVVIALATLFAFNSIGQNISFLDAFLITNITQFAIIFPITPGGMGIKQGIGLFLFSKIGINPAITLSMYLVLALIKYSIAFILSLFVRLPKNERINV